MLFASLRVLSGTLFFLVMAATIGIPSGKRGPAAAEPGVYLTLADVPLWSPPAAQR